MLGVETVLRILAPWSCLVCGTEGGLVCTPCTSMLPRPPGRCYRCYVEVGGGALCQKCLPSTPLSGAWTASEYKALSKDLVHQLKFERAGGSAGLLAQIMCDRLPSFESPVLVVPLPTANKRVRQRGYDQAVLLARAFAKKRGLVFTPLLVRQGTQRQVGANRQQRHAQLATAWRVKKPELVRGAHVLLVDDVLTTGATIESAANLCVQYGGAQVWAATFAQKL